MALSVDIRLCQDSACLTSLTDLTAPDALCVPSAPSPGCIANGAAVFCAFPAAFSAAHLSHASHES